MKVLLKSHYIDADSRAYHIYNFEFLLDDSLGIDAITGDERKPDIIGSDRRH